MKKPGYIFSHWELLLAFYARRRGTCAVCYSGEKGEGKRYRDRRGKKKNGAWNITADSAAMGSRESKRCVKIPINVKMSSIGSKAEAVVSLLLFHATDASRIFERETSHGRHRSNNKIVVCVCLFRSAFPSSLPPS